MWFLRIAEELSNVVPANRRAIRRSYLMWFLRIAEESQMSCYLMWFLRIAEELSNVVPANRRGAM